MQEVTKRSRYAKYITYKPSKIDTHMKLARVMMNNQD